MRALQQVLHRQRASEGPRGTISLATLTLQVKHTGIKPFVCELCNKRFARSGSLRVHAKSHTGLTRIDALSVGEMHEYVCTFDDCNKRFTSRSGFVNHQKKHTEDLKKNGESNEAVSVSPPVEPPPPWLYRLVVMYRAVQTERENEQFVYTCPIPGCYKTFNNKSSLNFHTYRVHLGIDASVCSKSRWYVLFSAADE